jgi:hypothetical protein
VIGRAGLVVLCLVGGAAAQTEWLDRLDRALAVSSPGDTARAELSGLVDLEEYTIDRRPPGLIVGGGDGVFNPRLTLFLDAWLGNRLYGFVQTRADRGFDPRGPAPAVRLDEYLLRWTPFAGPELHVQAGKFATVIGNWVPRHHSWDNPFVTAPLPYENVTIVSDASAPAGPGEFFTRRQSQDKKEIWVPIVWGPDYTSGAAVSGHVGRFDYAAEVKNAAPSSRPVVWDPTDRGWDDPTASARLGWRPWAALSLGTSFSAAPYLRSRAEPTLPAGTSLDDFRQWVIGGDVSYARHHLEVWAEFFASRFEVPNVGDADTAAWYLEGRYKLTPRLFAALRWNQQVFGDLEDARGRDRSWDRDGWRADSALTWRFDRHLQGKIQYSFFQQAGELQQGKQLLALQATVKF